MRAPFLMARPMKIRKPIREGGSRDRTENMHLVWHQWLWSALTWRGFSGQPITFGKRSKPRCFEFR
jgi:hypothetical protein